MSNVTVCGTLGRDPELKFGQSGKAILTFSICENKGKGDDQTSHWYDVTCFGTLAENLAESVGKGTRVIVVGQLEQQSWQTRDGEKRSKVAIVCWQAGPDLSFATATVSKNERE